VLVLAVL
jgi:large subunit ribosomal protein L27Ae